MRVILKLAAVLVVTMFVGCGGGQNRSDPEPASGQVSKERWMGFMQGALPREFCKEHQYFRQCFTVSAETCEETTRNVSGACLNKMSPRMPKYINAMDNARFARELGECSGRTYEIGLISKRINSARCNNVNNWTG